MQRHTAKLFFVFCMLLQGTNSISAARSQPTQLTPPNAAEISQEKDLNDFTRVKSSWRLSSTTRGKEFKKITRDKRKNPRPQSHKSILDDTQAPSNLYLPKQQAEVETAKILPLEISDLKELIEKNNPTLEVYKIEIEQQKYNLKKVLSAWYPTLDIAGGPEYLVGENFNESSADTESKQFKTSVSLDINWDLVNPKRSPDIATAKDTYQKAKTTYLIKLRDIQLEALKTYFLLQRSNEGVRIGKESLKASQISLKDAKARFEAGLGTRLEVLEAETQLARDKKLLTQKLGDQRINQSSLSEILNLPSNVKPIAASPLEIIGAWNMSLSESLIAAYAFREELENIRLDISINNNNANASLASAQPKLTIFNSLSNSYTNGKLASLNKDGSSINNTVGLKATWRIFDGGNARASYKYNKEMAKISEARFAEKRNLIRQEIEKHFFQLNTASDDIASSIHEVIAARESLRLARLRFKAGVSTQREVVNNQRDLTQAEVGYSNALNDYNTNIIELQRKTGINYTNACNPPKISAHKKGAKRNILLESVSIIETCNNSSPNN